jgi:hypothetical protein
MGVTIQRNFGPLADIPLGSVEIMRELGLLARERVIRRTLAGQETEGGPFAAYSEGYRKAKGKALGAVGHPNLFASGRMLGDIEIVDVTETRVELGFKS